MLSQTFFDYVYPRKKKKKITEIYANNGWIFGNFEPPFPIFQREEVQFLVYPVWYRTNMPHESYLVNFFPKYTNLFRLHLQYIMHITCAHTLFCI